MLLVNTKTGETIRFAEHVNNKQASYHEEGARSIKTQIDGKQVVMSIHPKRDNTRVNLNITTAKGKVSRCYIDNQSMRDQVAKKTQNLVFKSFSSKKDANAFVETLKAKAPAKPKSSKGAAKAATPKAAPTPQPTQPEAKQEPAVATAASAS